jgi:hypothetical protein
MDTDREFRLSDGVSLREYIDLRFAHIEDATKLARESMEKRLDGMNEFRQTLRDQAGKFVTSSELRTLEEKLSSHLESIGTRMTLELKPLHDFQVSSDAKASQSSLILVGVVSPAGLLLGIAKLFM